MTYTKTVWKDLPDTTTPITASRLNNIEDGVEYLFENSEAGIEIKNEYSNLQNSVYSCNYINIINGYSTNEIQIGVDEENKPIYKKTYITNENTGSSTVDISALNAKEIKDYNSICYRKGPNNDYERPYYAGADDYFRVFFRTNSASSDYPTSIQYRIANSYSLFKIKTTIYYTKTTD